MEKNMFSGGDSSGGHFCTAPPSATAAGIDWGQLALQWIQMRDTNTSTLPKANNDNYGMPVPPSPPIISSANNYLVQKKKSQSTYEEQGEADMEMDDDNEDNVGGLRNRNAESPAPPAPIVTQAQWYGVQTTVASELATTSLSSRQWTMWPPRVNVPPPTPVLTPQLTNTNPTAHIPSLLKINVVNPNDVSANQNSGNEGLGGNSNTMDANKRKLLPAWLREGLEKMEREKQKQLEREQLPNSSKHPTAIDSIDIEQKQFPNAITTSVINLNRNNLASDSSGNEDDDDDTIRAQYKAKKPSASTVAAGIAAKKACHAADMDEDVSDGVATQQNIIGKSYEQKMADLMIAVRRTLTELLLEVTNEEIANVAQETIKTRRFKASSAQVIRKSALTSITGKLGLAAYADSSSDENSTASDNDDNQTDKDKSDFDSEEEIKTSMRVKRRVFSKITEEIEERVAHAAIIEEQKLKHYTQLERELEAAASHKSNKHKDRRATAGPNASSSAASSNTVSKVYERDFGETSTDTKLQQFNGKRLNRKERMTRFSDNKDTKSTTLAAATNYINQMQQQEQQQQRASSNKSLPIPNPATALLQMSESVAHYNAAAFGNNGGVTNVLNAADAVLEKATKNKSSKKQKQPRHRRDHEHRERNRHTSDEDNDSTTSTSSDDSDDTSRSHSRSKSSSDSSRYSKQSSRASSFKRKRQESASSSRQRSQQHSRKKYESASSGRRRERSHDRNSDRSRDKHTSSSKRDRHRYSSDSNDYDYRSSSKYAKKREKRTRSRSRSRSRSTAYTSSQRRHR